VSSDVKLRGRRLRILSMLRLAPRHRKWGRISSTVQCSGVGSRGRSWVNPEVSSVRDSGSHPRPPGQQDAARRAGQRPGVKEHCSSPATTRARVASGEMIMSVDDVREILGLDVIGRSCPSRPMYCPHPNAGAPSSQRRRATRRAPTRTAVARLAGRNLAIALCRGNPRGVSSRACSEADMGLLALFRKKTPSTARGCKGEAAHHRGGRNDSASRKPRTTCRSYAANCSR